MNINKCVICIIFLTLPHWIASQCGIMEAKDEFGKDIIPWNVGIYTARDSLQGNWRLTCGGSLVKRNLVITAAHCFFIPKVPEPIPASNCTVAAGKLYKELNHPQDRTRQQEIKVDFIHLPEKYASNRQNEQLDLAILELRNSFLLSEWVQPVCLDMSNPDNIRNSVGMVSAWSDGKSKTRQMGAMPVIDLNTCRQKMSKFRFKKFITSSKICAGHLTRPFLCTEDGGSGLVFVEINNSMSRWSLRGVASARLQGRNVDTCRPGAYALFTKIFSLKDWILELFPDVDNVEISNKKIIQPVSGAALFLGKETEQDSKPKIPKIPSKVSVKKEKQDPKACRVPPLSMRATYSLLTDQTNSLKPDSVVNENQVLKINCRKRYDTRNDLTVCINGTWTPPILCQKRCELQESLTLIMICRDIFGNPLDCNSTVPSGSEISFSCKAFHKNLRYPKIKCEDGKFNLPIPECDIDCGVEKALGRATMIGAWKADSGTFPWHVGVYQDTSPKDEPRKFICGGSIISSKWIFSAAHCFFNEEIKMLQPPEKYFIAAGKRYRLWTHPDDNLREVQKSKVSTIFIPNEYKGREEYFAYDIAIVQVETQFEFTESVHAVCIDLDDEVFNRLQTKPGKEGKVAGWGLTEEGGKPSEELLTLNIPIIDIDECKTEVEQYKFRNFITQDKICGGFRNGSSLCQGDSGGGLVVSTVGNKDKIERWYLRGIVSSSPTNDKGKSCNQMSYSAFTLLYDHKELYRVIHANMTSNNLVKKTERVTGCQLPDFPDDGTYVVEDYHKEILPGEVVQPGTVLVYYCSDNYKLSLNRVQCHEDFTWSGNPVCTWIDESCTCTAASQGSKGKSEVICTPPRYDPDITYKVLGNPSMNPMMGLKEFTAVQWSCGEGTDPPQSTITYCSQKGWTPLPTCIKRCKMIKSNSMDFTCFDRTNNLIECTDTVPSGTVLVPSCKHYNVLNNINTMICTDGTYDNKPPTCKEVLIDPPESNTPGTIKEDDDILSGCLLPEAPEGGAYQAVGFNVTETESGPKAPFGSILMYFCSAGYDLSIPTSICGIKKWTSSPKCTKQCIMPTSFSIDFTCINSRGTKVDCKDKVSNGTVLVSTCKENHFIRSELHKMTCLEGYFDMPTPRCLPDCGVEYVTKTKKDEPYIAFPWHTTIYYEYSDSNERTAPEHICTGSLVTMNIVISAANCFWDEAELSLNPARLHYVAAGNLHREWYHQDDTVIYLNGKTYARQVQTSRVANIYVPSTYVGDEQNFENDLAILQLQDRLSPNKFVSPVCLDVLREDFYVEKNLDTSLGKTIVWDISNQDSEHLEEISLSIADSQKCKATLKQLKFNKYLTADKICTEFNKNSTICLGNGGSGLAFPLVDSKNKKKLWYLRALMSVVPNINEGYCGGVPAILFTDLDKHTDFILDTFSQINY